MGKVKRKSSLPSGKEGILVVFRTKPSADDVDALNAGFCTTLYVSRQPRWGKRRRRGDNSSGEA